MIPMRAATAAVRAGAAANHLRFPKRLFLSG